MPYIFFLLAIAALAPIYSAENVSLPCLLLNDTTARPCGPNCWELITRTSWTRDSRINNREKVYEEYTDSTLIGPLFVEKGIKPAIVCAAVKQPGKKVLAGLDTATINFVGPGWCKNEKDVWQSEAIFQNDQPTPSVTLLDPELIKTYYVWYPGMLAAAIVLLIFSVFFGLPWRKKVISGMLQILASVAFVWALILNICFFISLFAPPRPGPLTSWLLFISMAVSIIFLIAALFGSKKDPVGWQYGLVFYGFALTAAYLGLNARSWLAFSAYFLGGLAISGLVYLTFRLVAAALARKKKEPGKIRRATGKIFRSKRIIITEKTETKQKK